MKWEVKIFPRPLKRILSFLSSFLFFCCGTLIPIVCYSFSCLLLIHSLSSSLSFSLFNSIPLSHSHYLSSFVTSFFLSLSIIRHFLLCYQLPSFQISFSLSISLSFKHLLIYNLLLSVYRTIIPNSFHFTFAFNLLFGGISSIDLSLPHLFAWF